MVAAAPALVGLALAGCSVDEAKPVAPAVEVKATPDVAQSVESAPASASADTAAPSESAAKELAAAPTEKWTMLVPGMT
jgi:hypothetical protein